MEREMLSMDRGWRFHEGEVPCQKYNWHDILYTSTRSASAKGAAGRDFDDRSWRLVDVPHDYVVEGKPDPAAAGSHGSLIRRNAWYRKAFKLSQEDKGKYIALHFEGVCSACEIFVNGIPMMHHYTAGIGFELDITDVARYGEDINVVAVYIDNHDYEGWYYEGGGIYRHVWLIKTGKVHVDVWGTFVISEPLRDKRWNSGIETEIRNDYDTAKKAILISEIMDPDGKVVAYLSSDLELEARSKKTIVQSAMVSEVQTWDLDTPVLYQLRTAIVMDGKTEDTYLTDFGYRVITYTADDGFYLDGRKTFLLGYGSHQDLTGFGIGITDSISEFKMQRLKSMGFNMFRTAHNPFAPALYDACDRTGLMCMDENRRFISSPEVIDEVTRMVKRDRNHPSIIMWSLFNEEENRATETGQAMYRTLADVVHRLDPTRPATGADNTATAIPGAMDDIELIGINHVYDDAALDMVRENNPDKPIFFSEEDLTRDVLRYVKTRPWIFGALGWGGLPYRGETRWPQLHAGAQDGEKSVFSLLCDPEDGFYWNKAAWTKEPTVKIASHWTHPGREGEVIPVTVYANSKEAELFLNGKSLGKKEISDYTYSAVWDVEYMPGELVARARFGETEVTDMLVTTGAPARLKLSLENPGIRKNGRDTAIISAFLVDQNDRKLPIGPDLTVKFSVKQGGKFLCVGSPDKSDHESWQIPQIRLYRNRAQVYVESDAVSDILQVEAVCDGFAPALMTIEKEPGSAVKEVPIEENRFIYQFHISPARINLPEPDLDELHHHKPDMSEWLLFEVGRGNPDSFSFLPRRKTENDSVQSAGIVYYAATTVPANHGCADQMHLIFEKFEGRGRAVVFGEGQKRYEARKDSFPPASFRVDVTGLKEGEQAEVWVYVEADTMFCGVIRPVRWSFE